MTYSNFSFSSYLEQEAAKLSKGRIAFTVTYRGDRPFVSAAVIGSWGNTPETVECDRDVYRRVMADSCPIPDHPYRDYDRVEFWERGVLVETLLKQSIP